jgi:hypothetical protein
VAAVVHPRAWRSKPYTGIYQANSALNQLLTRLQAQQVTEKDPGSRETHLRSARKSITLTDKCDARSIKFLAILVKNVTETAMLG